MTLSAMFVRARPDKGIDLVELNNLLLTSDRSAVLRFLASLIHELTVLARCSYDEADAEAKLMSANESVHRMSGRLRDLCDPEEVLTVSRAEAIGLAAAMLGDGPLSRILIHTPL